MYILTPHFVRRIEGLFSAGSTLISAHLAEIKASILRIGSSRHKKTPPEGGVLKGNERRRL
jgi:hypothetical protein